MSVWTHVCQRKMTGLDSLDTTEPPLAICFYCFKDGSDPVLKGTLDWQDGVSIYHSECIAPEDWSELSACVLLALKKAYEMLGTGPIRGGLRAPT